MRGDQKQSVVIFFVHLAYLSLSEIFTFARNVNLSHTVVLNVECHLKCIQCPVPAAPGLAATAVLSALYKCELCIMCQI